MAGRWVSLGVAVDRAERGATYLRRAAVLLGRFETRGAGPDEAAVCRELASEMEHLAHTLEELACPPGGGQHHWSHLDQPDLFWLPRGQEMPEEACMPYVQAEAHEQPRDTWQRFRPPGAGPLIDMFTRGKKTEDGS